MPEASSLSTPAQTFPAQTEAYFNYESEFAVAIDTVAQLFIKILNQLHVFMSDQDFACTAIFRPELIDLFLRMNGNINNAVLSQLDTFRQTQQIIDILKQRISYFVDRNATFAEELLVASLIVDIDPSTIASTKQKTATYQHVETYQTPEYLQCKTGIEQSIAHTNNYIVDTANVINALYKDEQFSFLLVSKLELKEIFYKLCSNLQALNNSQRSAMHAARGILDMHKSKVMTLAEEHDKYIDELVTVNALVEELTEDLAPATTLRFQPRP